MTLNLSENYLRLNYTVMEDSVSQIAKKLMVSNSTILRRLHSYGIPVKSQGAYSSIPFLNLSKSEPFDILLGSLIGDGSITFSGKNPHYSEAHCIKQSPFLLWKNQYFKFSYGEYIDTDGFPYCQIRSSRRDFTIHKLYDIFYPCRIKTINHKILNSLSLLGLLVWYLDDGSLQIGRNNASHIHFYTNSFTYGEHLLIQKFFKTKFKIDVEIKEVGDRKLYLNCDSINTKNLINILTPVFFKYNLPKEMLYKLNYRDRYRLGNLNRNKHPSAYRFMKPPSEAKWQRIRQKRIK